MNQKVLKILEYPKIVERLSLLASSPPGKKACQDLQPYPTLDQAAAAQTETADALSRIFKKGAPSFSGNRDITFIVRGLSIGSTLSAAELLRIASLLECAFRIKNYGRPERDSEQADSLTEDFELLEPITMLLREIRRCILEEDFISDDASPALSSIRKSIARIGDKIHSQLNSMVNGRYRTYLQDSIITIRNNRYCIPVKAEHKAQVPGMVHDQSSSGSTLFIEPSAIVNLNNQLKELALKEEEEIQQILKDLSLQAAEHSAALLNDQKILTRLDFIFAKAALAAEQKASMPIFNTERRIRIRQGRHPLLDKHKVVPIDIHLGDTFDLLVVTGPNTGGKTVSLKTVGLFTLMGQAGLHIPAGDRSELGFFHKVYADIGDEQSIEQSLSTFSSHMTNIVPILKHADQDCLCLFDELGAGTDPVEGAALAVAILDNLHQRGIRTMATTHYSELKVYALSTPGVENASCEFNVETLSPTYRLLIGIPGKSNAFAISSKLGLPDAIIQRARDQITEEKTSFEDLISDLEHKRLSIESDKLEAARMKEEMERLKKELEKRQEKLDSARDHILREANEKARQILQDAKDSADKTIRVFQKAGPGASMKELEKEREKIRGKISEKDKKLVKKATEAKTGNLKPEQLKKGDSVKVLSMGLKGTISSLPDKKGNLFVTCGIIRSQVHIKDLVLLQDDDVTTSVSNKRTGAGKIRMSKSLSVSPEINLLGKRVDEAIAELDKYLDDAYLAHLSSVRIVHGKGTGALRSAIHSHLRGMKHVADYHLGAFGEGDAGVTIATFK